MVVVRTPRAVKRFQLGMICFEDGESEIQKSTKMVNIGMAKATSPVIASGTWSIPLIGCKSYSTNSARDTAGKKQQLRFTHM
ncbi:hypothetical protein L1987_70172 [Smallanthus sonchifolius]|uniref:Uncharacterized protein n=1 Tax=Smallanthus sonchifolius TaxID=185202 RepID=A0ACB9AQG9_9ASTR|nr:hypothetical protein L1987_70172 [Smallanthus sonchifolius]